MVSRTTEHQWSPFCNSSVCGLEVSESPDYAFCPALPPRLVPCVFIRDWLPLRPGSRLHWNGKPVRRPPPLAGGLWSETCGLPAWQEGWPELISILAMSPAPATTSEFFQGAPLSRLEVVSALPALLERRSSWPSLSPLPSFFSSAYGTLLSPGFVLSPCYKTFEVLGS